MMKFQLISILSFLAFRLSAQFLQPFEWSDDYCEQTGILTLSVVVPDGHYLYADKTSISVDSNGKSIHPNTKPQTISHSDEFGSHQIYPPGKTYSWKYTLSPNSPYRVDIKFQGCKDTGGGSPAVCFMPAEKIFESKNYQANNLKGNIQTNQNQTPNLKNSEIDTILDQFAIIKTGGGYMNSADFLKFLDFLGDKGKSLIENRGAFSLILFVLFGGLLLNFTPCVLPMIPINLAIIGAGSEAKTKAHGFIKGGIYGLAIALSYGILGLVSVLTGAKFGTLNSSPIFNFIIAAVFILLALAMFDVFSIDLSRYSAKMGTPDKNRGSYFAIFAMGIVAALLAGACVAPVVIAVLLYSTTIYASGNITGLFLPFLLGLGMGIPWPFAGAGIAVIPKPGAWMLKIKYGFGVLITLFALYYGYLAVTLSTQKRDSYAESSFAILHSKLLESLQTRKPIFIDFWAHWCKNCSAMENTTFKNPEVIKRLDDFVVVKFQAEDMKNPEVRKLLDRFSIPGLPGFVILKPKK